MRHGPVIAAQVLVRPGEPPRMPQVDYGQCAHLKTWKNGFNPTVKRGPVQRFRCAFCGRKFEGASRSLLERRVAIGKDLARGLSIRAVSRRNGVSRQAVRFVRDVLGDRRPALCGCGKPVGHSGRRLRNCSKV